MVENSADYDVVIVGSGTCGATLSKALASEGKKVLMLEQGSAAPLRDSFAGVAAIAREVAVGSGMKAAKAITVGGSTGLYFAVANKPPLAYFEQLGIDLSDDVQQLWQELPIAPLADNLISPQSKLLADTAAGMGIELQRNEMLIDQQKCHGGYSYEAKWKARGWVVEAQQLGAELISGAQVQDVVIEGNRAVAVNYKVKQGLFSSQMKQARGKKIILAGGSLSTPQMLRNCGISDVGAKGFYCDPGIPIFGLVPQLQGQSGFVGTSQCHYEPGIDFGDANMTPLFHRMLMLMNFKFRHMFAFERTLGFGVKVTDGLGGSLSADGKLSKPLTAQDLAKLEKGKKVVIDILKNAGAEHIFCAPVTSTGHVGGMVRIGEQVDSDLKTAIENLYVCDGSLLDENIRVTPTVTLICLARHLARHLNQVL